VPAGQELPGDLGSGDPDLIVPLGFHAPIMPMDSTPHNRPEVPILAGTPARKPNHYPLWPLCAHPQQVVVVPHQPLHLVVVQILTHYI
jgi:hypothetical protein